MEDEQISSIFMKLNQLWFMLFKKKNHLHVDVVPSISVSGAVHPGVFRWRRSGRTCNFPRLIATVRSRMLIMNDTIHASNTASILFLYGKSGEFTSDEILLLTDSLSGYVSDPMSTMRYCSSFSSGGSFEDSN